MDHPLCKECPVHNHSNYIHLDDSFLEIFECIKTVCRFNAKEIIFEKGQDSSGFYCLNKGSARTFIQDSLEPKKELTLSMYGKGDWLGFRDSITSKTHHHSAITIEPVEACFFSGKDLKNLLRLHENIQFDLLEKFAKRAREYENKIFSLGVKDKHRRLAEFILDLYNASKTKPVIEIKVSRRVIASMIGASQEFVFRALSDFKDRLWIDISPKTIEVKNIEKLTKFARVD